MRWKVFGYGALCSVLMGAMSAGQAWADEKEAWLAAKLYGGDNEAAALRGVTIEAVDDGYRIAIANQFAFECGLTFDANGDPSVLRDCESKLDEPGSRWTATPNEIHLSCSSLKGERVCRGRYTLASGSYSSASEMTFARRLDGAANVQTTVEAVPLSRLIKDWTVECDEERYCQASSRYIGGDAPNLQLTIERGPKKNSKAVARVMYNNGKAERFQLQADGQALPDSLVMAFHLLSAEYPVRLEAEGDAVTSIIKEWRNAQALQLKVEPADGPLPSVSLSGFSAAMLLIDAVQGRVDTADALYKPAQN